MIKQSGLSKTLKPLGTSLPRMWYWRPSSILRRRRFTWRRLTPLRLNERPPRKAAYFPFAPTVQRRLHLFTHAASFSAGTLLGSSRLITIIYCALTILRPPVCWSFDWIFCESLSQALHDLRGVPGGLIWRRPH